MRFLRMRPAVCAMISCSFSSLTRKVAFGSNSVTTPGNSSNSSFAIRYPDSLLEHIPLRLNGDGLQVLLLSHVPLGEPASNPSSQSPKPSFSWTYSRQP